MSMDTDTNAIIDVLIDASEGLTYADAGLGGTAPLVGYPFESAVQMVYLVTAALRNRMTTPTDPAPQRAADGERRALLRPEQCQMLVTLLKMVERKIDTWQAVCAAVDEFGHDSAAVGERADIDDTVMREIVTLTDGLEDEWKATFQKLLYQAKIAAAPAADGDGQPVTGYRAARGIALVPEGAEPPEATVRRMRGNTATQPAAADDFAALRAAAEAVSNTRELGTILPSGYFIDREVGKYLYAANPATVTALLARAQAAERQVAALRAAVWKAANYLKHDDPCAAQALGLNACSCGLEPAMQRLYAALLPPAAPTAPDGASPR